MSRRICKTWEPQAPEAESLAPSKDLKESLILELKLGQVNSWPHS